MCAVGPRAFFAGLIDPARVGDELTQQNGAGEDGDVLAVADAVADVAGPAQAEVDLIRRNEQAPALVDDGVAGDQRRGGQGPIGGASLGGGGERLGGSGSMQGAMRPLVVVKLAELVEEIVELGDGLWGWAGPQPLLEGLPQPFDLAAGLRMKWARVDRDRMASNEHSNPRHFPV